MAEKPNNSLIFGYGTSHDCGVAVVEKQSGCPVFCASLERMSRRKNQDGSPAAILNWAHREDSRIGSKFSVCPIFDEQIFSFDRGFHGLEHAALMDYRWTGQSAELPISDGDFRYVAIALVPTHLCRRFLKAVIHMDNTARPQFVVQAHNPRFHAILSAYYKLTVVPVVINTSSKMHEETIIASPYDAFRCFQLGHLDVLVMGNYIIENENSGIPTNAE